MIKEGLALRIRGETLHISRATVILRGGPQTPKIQINRIIIGRTFCVQNWIRSVGERI